MIRIPMVPALLLLTAAAARGQEPMPLSRGQTLEAEIPTGAVRQYAIRSRAGQFVFGEVDQRTVDVVVTIYGPDGLELARFDGPARGPEPFQFRAAEAGTYRVEVAPFQQEAGRYAITLRRLEPLATSPEGQVDQLMAPYTGRDRPGGVVAVTRGGRIVFARGYGMANLEDGIPNTPATVYHMASVSKQFTAFAIAMLADQGKLGLDDDVRRYLPNVPDFGRTITLRHLLTHTSGLRDQWELWGMAGGLMDDVIRQQDLLRLVERQRELNFDPGAEYLYSNTGFMLLSEVVAKVGGAPFPAWMQTNIFTPLGMTASQIYDDHERLVKGRAYSYQSGADGAKKSVLSYANMGATSLFTTAEDLARWLGNWHSGRVGGPRVLAMMQERGVLNRGDTLPYALGIGARYYRGLPILAHGGSDAGYRTALVYLPTPDAGVIVLGNTASLNAGNVSEQVMDAFFADVLAPKTVPPPLAQPPAGTVVVAASLLRSYAGTFVLTPGSTVEFAVDGDRLFIQVAGQPRFPMTPLADTLFRVEVPGVDAVVEFVPGSSGPTIAGTIHQNGDHPFRRLEPWSPGVADLAAFAGRYWSPELETSYTILEKDGQLVARHRRHGDIPLSPREPDQFDGGQWFFGRVLFLRDSGGAVTGFRVTGGRVRNLLFERMP
jgi:CubicO group peptidase (beta-lactamase class C family)